METEQMWESTYDLGCEMQCREVRACHKHSQSLSQSNTRAQPSTVDCLCSEGRLGVN